MNNLLLDPSKWSRDSYDLGWNGSSWEWLFNGYAPGLALVGGALSGDVIAGEASGSNDEYNNPMYLNVVEDGVVVSSTPLVPGGEFSIPVNPGSTYSVICHSWPDGNSPQEIYGVSMKIAPLQINPAVSYNCECDDDYPRATLAQMRSRVIARLGMAAMPAGLPGMAALIDDFLRGAQEQLYRRYSVFRMERFFTWDLLKGVRFYDYPENRDACTKKVDPRKITWVGITQGDDSWRPLHCGINPTMYSSRADGIPTNYEMRQCIEVWPAPVDDTWQLRVKGHFGLGAFAADTDVTSIDPEAIFLMALANAKAHYGQPDGGNYMQQLQVYIGDLVAGSHQTRRYLPGRIPLRNAVPPRIV